MGFPILISNIFILNHPQGPYTESFFHLQVFFFNNNTRCVHHFLLTLTSLSKSWTCSSSFCSSEYCPRKSSKIVDTVWMASSNVVGRDIDVSLMGSDVIRISNNFGRCCWLSRESFKDPVFMIATEFGRRAGFVWSFSVVDSLCTLRRLLALEERDGSELWCWLDRPLWSAMSCNRSHSKVTSVPCIHLQSISFDGCFEQSYR